MTHAMIWPVVAVYDSNSQPASGLEHPESLVKTRSAGQVIELTPQETVFCTWPPLAVVANSAKVPEIRTVKFVELAVPVSVWLIVKGGIPV